MKIPEPIIEPTTSAVASSREMAFTNSAWTGGCCAVAMRVLAREKERAWDNLVSPDGARYLFARTDPPPREVRRAPVTA